METLAEFNCAPKSDLDRAGKASEQVLEALRSDEKYPTKAKLCSWWLQLINKHNIKGEIHGNNNEKFN